MDGEKFLYCPQKIKGRECSKKICRIGKGRFHRSLYVKCPKCKSMIHYNAETEEAEVSDMVYERKHSSGKRFY